MTSGLQLGIKRLWIRKVVFCVVVNDKPPTMTCAVSNFDVDIVPTREVQSGGLL